MRACVVLHWHRVEVCVDIHDDRNPTLRVASWLAKSIMDSRIIPKVRCGSKRIMLKVEHITLSFYPFREGLPAFRRRTI